MSAAGVPQPLYHPPPTAADVPPLKAFHRIQKTVIFVTVCRALLLTPRGTNFVTPVGYSVTLFVTPLILGVCWPAGYHFAGNRGGRGQPALDRYQADSPERQ